MQGKAYKFATPLFPHSRNSNRPRGQAAPLLHVCSNRPHGWTNHATAVHLQQQAVWTTTSRRRCLCMTWRRAVPLHIPRWTDGRTKSHNTIYTALTQTRVVKIWYICAWVIQRHYKRCHSTEHTISYFSFLISICLSQAVSEVQFVHLQPQQNQMLKHTPI